MPSSPIPSALTWRATQPTSRSTRTPAPGQRFASPPGPANAASPRRTTRPAVAARPPPHRYKPPIIANRLTVLLPRRQAGPGRNRRGVLSPRIDDREPILTRPGYDVRTRAEQLNAGHMENPTRYFFRVGTVARLGVQRRSGISALVLASVTALIKSGETSIP